jgi:hypothetical protein
MGYDRAFGGGGAALGRPKPMLPRPPDVTHQHGLAKGYHWAVWVGGGYIAGGRQDSTAGTGMKSFDKERR